jgi:hypothetical protein
MITLNVIGDVITGSYNGTNFGVEFTQDRYDQMLALQTETEGADSIQEVKEIIERFALLTVEDFKATVEGASEFLHHNTKTGQTFLKYNKVISNVPMPKGLVDRINESIEKKIDIQPLVKFWVRTLRNPMLNPRKVKRIVNYINATYMDSDVAFDLVANEGLTREAAEARATTRQVSITNEGLLQTYKVSREKDMKFDTKTGELVSRYEVTFDEETGVKSYDKPKFAEDLVFEPAVQRGGGDSFACGDVLGHIIKVGETHRLESWDQVNCNDGVSCVKGLHVGNLDYIRGYQHDDTVTHNVFVDPMFIGAVPDDASGAIRCKEYMVYDTFKGVTKSLYRSSEYAKQTDVKWNEMLAEAVKTHDEFIKEIVKESDEATKRLNSLDI